METSDSGSMGALQDKDIWVRIYDKTGARLLSDNLGRRRACMVEGEGDWPTLDNLEVVIREVGNPRASDPANVALVRSGPRTLFRVTYRYDRAKGQFERVHR